MNSLFQTICADPPWKFGDKLPGKSRGAEKNYRVMTATEVSAYPHRTALDGTVRLNGTISDHFAPDSRLFLWRVASMQEEALAVMKAWGFTQKAEVVWVKKTATGKRHFGMGRQVRMEHEVCLIGTRGKPPTLSRSIRSVFEAPYTRHSGKPEAFYKEIVECLSPGPYLELFARHERQGWTCIGDEL